MKVRKQKNCFKCNETFSELFRIRLDQEKSWIFVCKSCLKERKSKSVFYQYGGTWKLRKAN